MPGQLAIQTALGGYQALDLRSRGKVTRQRDLAYDLVSQIPGVSCEADAAMYLFPRLDPKNIKLIMTKSLF